MTGGLSGLLPLGGKTKLWLLPYWADVAATEPVEGGILRGVMVAVGNDGLSMSGARAFSGDSGLSNSLRMLLALRPSSKLFLLLRDEARGVYMIPPALPFRLPVLLFARFVTEVAVAPINIFSC